jgi:hypothetical protein
VDDNRLSRWLKFQQVTWQSDAGAKASEIVLERPDGEKVASFDINRSNLAQIVADCLTMQGDELPIGSHSYRLVSYDDAHKQLAELPQTVRGRNREATSAASDAMAMQRAVAQSLRNLESVASLNEQIQNRLAETLDNERDNTNQLLDMNRQLRDNNLEHELRLRQFEKREERIDKFLEGAGGLITLLAPLLIKKFLPELAASEMVAKQLDSMTEKAKPNERPSEGPEEPISATSVVVPEPEQRALSPNDQAGPARDGGAVPEESSEPSRRRAITKRPPARATRVKTKERRRK